MKGILTLESVLFLFLLTQRASAFPRGEQDSRAIETVSFCDMIKRPADFDGRTVKLAVIYSHTVHEDVFYDRTCLEHAVSEETALAKFSRSTPDSARASEMIGRALKKYKTDELQVTMIAVFSDPQIAGNIPRSSCWFNLEVTQVQAVQPATPVKT